jgi:DNA transformation protein
VGDAGELRRLGSGRAFEKIRPELPEDARTHTLLALEGALRGMRWTAIPQTERDTLVDRVLGAPELTGAPRAAASGRVD